MSTIELNDAALELVRREMMKSAVRDLEAAIEALSQLAIVAPWEGTNVLASDTRTAVSIAREGLDILDRLGWPEGT
jgi:hypothetical protein